ncbi:MAG TPA: hypothetical protein VNR39_12740 [Pseudolabrys sp.]|nr:hypothetical protein [Pseudolabrys sp.]
MRRLIVAAALFSAMTVSSPALAQERTGCDQFKWPLARERALMAKPIDAASGAAIADPFAAALKIALAPQADVALPLKPERALREPSAYAGFLRFAAPPRAGTVRITLSANAWIDVIQDDKALPADEFSGVQGCEGLRKSVKFALAATPFVVQLSGASVQSIVVTVTQD